MEEKINEIKITTIMDKDDYRAMVYFNIFIKARIRAILFVIIGLIVIVELGLHFIGIRKVVGFELYFDYFIILVMMALPIEIEAISKRMMNRDYVKIGKVQQIIINNVGIICEGNSKEIKYEWPLMYRAYENSKYFFVFVNMQQAVIIPKRDLKNKTEDEIRSIIDKKILNKNKLRKR